MNCVVDLENNNVAYFIFANVAMASNFLNCSILSAYLASLWRIDDVNRLSKISLSVLLLFYKLRGMYLFFNIQEQVW